MLTCCVEKCRSKYNTGQGGRAINYQMPPLDTMKTFTNTVVASIHDYINSERASLKHNQHKKRLPLDQTNSTSARQRVAGQPQGTTHRRATPGQDQPLGLRLLELSGDTVDLLLSGRLLVLHQLLIPRRHAPVVRLGHRRRIRPSRGGIQFGPVLLIRPSPYPRLSVQHQAGSPQIVFVVRGGELASLFPQLLGHGAHVVRLDLAAAADVADAHVVGSPGVPVHVPAGDDARLQS